MLFPLYYFIKMAFPSPRTRLYIGAIFIRFVDERGFVLRPIYFARRACSRLSRAGGKKKNININNWRFLAESVRSTSYYIYMRYTQLYIGCTQTVTGALIELEPSADKMTTELSTLWSCYLLSAEKILFPSSLRSLATVTSLRSLLYNNNYYYNNNIYIICIYDTSANGNPSRMLQYARVVARWTVCILQ